MCVCLYACVLHQFLFGYLLGGMGWGKGGEKEIVKGGGIGHILLLPIYSYILWGLTFGFLLTADGEAGGGWGCTHPEKQQLEEENNTRICDCTIRATQYCVCVVLSKWSHSFSFSSHAPHKKAREDEERIPTPHLGTTQPSKQTKNSRQLLLLLLPSFFLLLSLSLYMYIYILRVAHRCLFEGVLLKSQCELVTYKCFGMGGNGGRRPPGGGTACIEFCCCLLHKKPEMHKHILFGH